MEVIPVQNQPHRSIPRWMALAVGLSAAAVLFAWIMGTPTGVDGKLDAVAYAICHRIDARSFLVNGMPMPLCARCTGIYLGVMTCFLIALASGRTKISRLPPLGVSIVLVLFVGIMGFDGVNSYFCGVALFSFTFPIFNGIVWRNSDWHRGVNNLRELGGICIVAGCVVLLVLTQRPVFLWVFGLVSTLGVVLMLTMIGTVTFLSVTHLDRNAIMWRHMAIPLLAGLTLAFIELGAMDLLRYALTGTWNGFPLGG